MNLLQSSQKLFCINAGNAKTNQACRNQNSQNCKPQMFSGFLSHLFSKKRVTRVFDQVFAKKSENMKKGLFQNFFHKHEGQKGIKNPQKNIDHIMML